MAANEYWWTTPKSEAHKVAGSVFNAVAQLESQQRQREDVEYYLNLFEAEPRIEACLPSTVMPPRLMADGQRLYYNIGRSVIQAFVARIASQKIKARFLTTGGTYSDKLKGRQLTYFSAGLSHAARIGRIQNDMVMDGAICGRGAVGVGPNWLGTEVVTERAHPACVYIDGHKFGRPHTWYWIRHASKEAVAQANPKHRQAIMESASNMTFESDRNVDPDCLVLVEAWHPDDNGGRHVITTDKITLLDKPWVDAKGKPFRRPGIITWEFCSPTTGQQGRGIYADIADLVEEINVTLKKMQEGMQMASIHILLNAASGLKREQINNCPHSVWTYNGGEPPTIITIPGITAEQIQWVSYLTDQVYQRIGMNQLFANSEKPAGVTSAVAMNTLNDTASQRFQNSMQFVEQAICDIAEAQVDAAREIYELQGSYRVKLPLYDSSTEIDWGDINLDRDKYLCRAIPVNLIADSEAGQLEKAVTLATNDPDMGAYLLEMLDYPDIASIVARKIQSRQLADKFVENCHKGKRVPAADPDMGIEWLTMAIKVFQDAYLSAQLAEESDEVLNRLVAWKLQAQGVLDSLQAPAPAPAPMMGMGVPQDPAAQLMGTPPPDVAAPLDMGATPPVSGVM